MSEELTTQIKDVTVFQSGARITRVGTLELDAGKHIIELKKLTRDLDKESVRVRGTGAGRIINVNIEKHSTTVSKQEETDVFKEKIHNLEKQMGFLSEEIHALDEEQKQYGIFANNFYEKSALAYSASELDLDRIVIMEGHVKEQALKVRDTRRELQKQTEDIQKELDQARIELNNIGPLVKIEEYYDILINIESDEAGTFDLEIQFQIPNASWNPFYDVVLTEENAHVKLMANVFNTSGENWDDIDLEISSANLSSVKIIEPTPYIVREYIYRPPAEEKPRRMMAPKKAMAPMGGAMANIASADESSVEEKEEIGDFRAPPAPPPLQVLSAVVQENVGVQSYKLPLPLSIPSDKNPHPVTLIETELSSKKGYFWSVATSDQVLIKDTLTNGEILLLPGHAKVYFIGDFIGESEIPLIAPHETIDLGTRISYDLKIEKKLKNRESNKEGVIIKGKVTKHYEYEIKITVLKPSENEIKLMDRIVFSDSEKIKANLLQCEPSPTSKDMGILVWKLSLKDKSEILINYTFDVTYEKSIRISPSLP